MYADNDEDVMEYEEQYADEQYGEEDQEITTELWQASQKLEKILNKYLGSLLGGNFCIF